MPPTPLPLFTYDPTQVTFTIDNQTIVGPDKGTFLKVTYDSPLWTDDVGANGDVVRVRNADARGWIEVTTMASSPSNDVLSALAAADALSGTGVRSATVKDGTGRSIHSGTSCWVEKIPDAEYSTEATSRVFRVRVARLSSFVGGTN